MVVREPYESIESLLKRFKKAVERDATLTEARRHEYAASRRERRRRKDHAALGRERKRRTAPKNAL